MGLNHYFLVYLLEEKTMRELRPEIIRPERVEPPKGETIPVSADLLREGAKNLPVQEGTRVLRARIGQTGNTLSVYQIGDVSAGVYTLLVGSRMYSADLCYALQISCSGKREARSFARKLGLPVQDLEGRV